MLLISTISTMINLSVFENTTSYCIEQVAPDVFECVYSRTCNVHVCVLWHAGVLKVTSHSDNYWAVFDDVKRLFEVELCLVSLEMMSVRNTSFFFGLLKAVRAIINDPNDSRDFNLSENMRCEPFMFPSHSFYLTCF